MLRVRIPVVLALLVAAGAARAEVAGPQSTGNIISRFLGLKSAAPAEPMALTAPAPTKITPGKAQPGQPAKAKAKSGDDNATARSAAKPGKAKQNAAAKEPKAPASVAKIDSPIDPKPTTTEAGSDPAPNMSPRKTVRLGPFRGGGSQAICVRTCDGFFFPVNYEGAHGVDRYEEACQSSCPAAKTEVYFMPRGADLTRAATARGERYSALDTAFKYRKERDATCTCKGENQSWAEVLTPVDALVKTGKTDIVVTPERSEELARPADPAATPEPQPVKSAAGKKNPKAAKAEDKATGAKAAPARTATTNRAADTRAMFDRDLIKGAPHGAWRQSDRFTRIDPEPTASITRAGD